MMEEKLKMLIVDDNQGFASSLKDILEFKGYNAAIAGDGQIALTLCHEKVFDLALIDIKLPDIPGEKLVAELSELSPIMEYIMITGHASLETAIEAVGQRHIIAYETKPLNMDHLLALVAQVNERKKAEKRLVEYEELDRFKGNLLSLVSHELRTPLAITKGYSTMLLDYDRRLRRDEKRRYLESIDKTTDRSIELVDHLLDMSRLEAGLLKLDKQPTKISKLVEEMVAEARLRDTKHEIVTDLRQRLPCMNIDAKRIRQVLDNLINNAIKYSGGGTKVVIEAQRVGAELQVSVADQGRGILAEDLQRIFDRMYRIEHRLTPEMGGVGLGLPICKGLVEAHSGHIWVESEADKGSTFYFTLPIETTNEGQGDGKDT